VPSESGEGEKRGGEKAAQLGIGPIYVEGLFVEGFVRYTQMQRHRSLLLDRSGIVLVDAVFLPFRPQVFSLRL
jgi:hypothetical protein